MIEGDTLTVQVKEPCADGYIHPEWVGDSYLDFIKAEMMEDCFEGCDDSDSAEVCETKCKAVTPRGNGGKPGNQVIITYNTSGSPKLNFRFSVSSESIHVVHSKPQNQLYLESENGKKDIWQNVTVTDLEHT